MKRFDVKHLAFHVLVALYFIWAFVFAVLLALAVGNEAGAHNEGLAALFPAWILMNLVMGSALFVVIRLFSRTGLAVRTVLFSFVALAAGGLGVMLYLAIKA